MKEPGPEYYYGLKAKDQPPSAESPQERSSTLPRWLTPTFPSAFSQSPVMVKAVAKPLRRMPLGFGPLLISAGASAMVRSMPQLTFKGQILVVPPSIASAFQINDVRVGKFSELPSAEGISAETLALENLADLEQVWREFSRWDMTFCQIGQSISISVTNVSGAQVQFAATLFGLVVDP